VPCGRGWWGLVQPRRHQAHHPTEHETTEREGPVVGTVPTGAQQTDPLSRWPRRMHPPAVRPIRRERVRATRAGQKGEWVLMPTRVSRRYAP